MTEEKGTTQEPVGSEEDKRNILQRIFVRRNSAHSAWLPILAVFSALVIGGVIIILSSPEVSTAWKEEGFFGTIGTSWTVVKRAYIALLEGAFGVPADIVAAIKTYSDTGETRPLLDAFRPIAESLMLATPYIFSGLAVSVGFRGGLFNIGAEGQLFVGGLAAVVVGYSFEGLPGYIHLPLALAAGILAGALWASVVGFLKAYTGAHEVINTIMMNYIAFSITDYLLTGPIINRTQGISREVKPSAYLPQIFPRPMRVHYGFILAILVAFLVYWFLWKTKYGLEIRMVGANPNASRYAGINIKKITVLTMVISGALAGLAGASQMLGIDHRMVRTFSPGYGFDAIALALLGNSHPLGVVLASLLFGMMRAGSPRMQSIAHVPVEMIRVVQALVIIFVAAPAIVRSIYRIKAKRAEEEILLQGWGS